VRCIAESSCSDGNQALQFPAAGTVWAQTSSWVFYSEHYVCVCVCVICFFVAVVCIMTMYVNVHTETVVAVCCCCASYLDRLVLLCVKLNTNIGKLCSYEHLFVISPCCKIVLKYDDKIS